MRNLLLATSGILLFFALSCSKKSEDTVNNPPPGGGNNCDTANRKYTTHVVPILQANCYACHGTATNSGSGGIVLQGYDNIHAYATNGTLVGVITHASGFPAMPQGGAKLSDCNINIIKSWINNGAQNN